MVRYQLVIRVVVTTDHLEGDCANGCQETRREETGCESPGQEDRGKEEEVVSLLRSSVNSRTPQAYPVCGASLCGGGPLSALKPAQTISRHLNNLTSASHPSAAHLPADPLRSLFLYAFTFF